MSEQMTKEKTTSIYHDTDMIDKTIILTNMFYDGSQIDLFLALSLNVLGFKTFKDVEFNKNSIATYKKSSFYTSSQESIKIGLFLDKLTSFNPPILYFDSNRNDFSYVQNLLLNYQDYVKMLNSVLYRINNTPEIDYQWLVDNYKFAYKSIFEGFKEKDFEGLSKEQIDLKIKKREQERERIASMDEDKFRKSDFSFDKAFSVLKQIIDRYISKISYITNNAININTIYDFKKYYDMMMADDNFQLPYMLADSSINSLLESIVRKNIDKPVTKIAEEWFLNPIKYVNEQGKLVGHKELNDIKKQGKLVGLKELNDIKKPLKLKLQTKMILSSLDEGKEIADTNLDKFVSLDDKLNSDFDYKTAEEMFSMIEANTKIPDGDILIDNSGNVVTDYSLRSILPESDVSIENTNLKNIKFNDEKMKPLYENVINFISKKIQTDYALYEELKQKATNGRNLISEYHDRSMDNLRGINRERFNQITIEVDKLREEFNTYNLKSFEEFELDTKFDVAIKNKIVWDSIKKYTSIDYESVNKEKFIEEVCDSLYLFNKNQSERPTKDDLSYDDIINDINEFKKLYNIALNPPIENLNDLLEDTKEVTDELKDVELDEILSTSELSNTEPDLMSEVLNVNHSIHEDVKKHHKLHVDIFKEIMEYNNIYITLEVVHLCNILSDLWSLRIKAFSFDFCMHLYQATLKDPKLNSLFKKSASSPQILAGYLITKSYKKLGSLHPSDPVFYTVSNTSYSKPQDKNKKFKVWEYYTQNGRIGKAIDSLTIIFDELIQEISNKDSLKSMLEDIYAYKIKSNYGKGNDKYYYELSFDNVTENRLEKKYISL